MSLCGVLLAHTVATASGESLSRLCLSRNVNEIGCCSCFCGPYWEACSQESA